MKSYQDLLRYVLENGEPHRDRTGVGTTSVFGYQWRHRMSEGFPILTTKRVGFRWVAEELKWFLRGEHRVDSLEHAGVDIWKEWATAEQCAKFDREPGDMGPVYGALWAAFPIGWSDADFMHCAKNTSVYRLAGSTDQIAQLLDDVQATPNSRRLIVTGWHPYYARRVTLPPCHTLWQIKCHEPTLSSDGLKAMSLHLYARSIDSFLGLPFDIASYALLLELLAFATGRVAQDLIISFGDLHVYGNHGAAVAECLSREPRQLPKLSFINTSEGWEGCGLSTVEAFANGQLNCELLDYDPHPKIEAEVAV